MKKVWVSDEATHLSRLHWLPGLLDCSGLLGGYWLALQALPRQVVLAAQLVPSPLAASSLVRAAQGCLQQEHRLSVTAPYTSHYNGTSAAAVGHKSCGVFASCLEGISSPCV